MKLSIDIKQPAPDAAYFENARTHFAKKAANTKKIESLLYWQAGLIAVVGFLCFLLLSRYEVITNQEGAFGVILSFLLAFFVTLSTGSWTCEATTSHERIIALTELAEPKQYLNICEWLENEVIRNYRDSVIEQGRTFRNIEVMALQMYWEEHLSSSSKAKKSLIDVFPGVTAPA